MKRIYYLTFVLFFTNLNFVLSQRADRFLLHEQITDAYMPPSKNIQFTPAYRYDTTFFFTRQVNVSENGTNIIGDAANEPSIAVDPTNPQRIVIGWRQFDNVNSSFRQAGYAYSEDGGEVWINRGVLIDPGHFRSDPVLDFDADGNFYYNSLGVDNDDNMWCDVFRIKDGGFDWDEGAYANGGDKQWMRIDRGETEGKGNIYAEWNQMFSVCNEGSFTRSVDGGDSYGSCIPVTDDPYWGTLAVGPLGEVYEVGVTSNYNSGVVVVKSTSAMDPESEVTWESSSSVDLHGNLTGWSDINPQGLVGQAWVDVDKSEGPGKGYVYVLASVQRSDVNDPADVMFARSTDGGITWDDPVRINTDSDHSNYQWLGTMSVAPNGRIDIVWLDTRDAPNNHPHNSALYYSFSVDNGETFSANEKLSESFNPHLGYPQQLKMGDYFDMVSDNNGAHLAWAATFNGEEDVYYAHIVPAFIMGEKENQTEINDVNFGVFPNPVNSTSKFSWKLNENGPVNLKIVDIVGNVIYEMQTNQQKGKHYLNLDKLSLSNGIYIALLKTESQVSKLKFIVK